MGEHLAARRINRAHALTVISAGILVGTEIIAASLALGWAIGGLMDLGPIVNLALIGLSLLGGLWMTYAFVRAALRVEPIFEPG
jgi:hypothetical protein